MLESSQLAVYGWLILAGLAGSLHCIGMCGPILLSFSQVFDAAARRRGDPAAPLLSDFAWYHAGRIWTYGILGFLAGWAGKGLRDASAYLGWQRPVSILIGVTIVAAGLLVLGIVPTPKLKRLAHGCGFERLGVRPWFELLHGPGRLRRLLLGATMGLLPCGLVYAMLTVAAALPTPAHGALGMLIFGLGTVPSLSAVLLIGRAVPPRLRLQGSRLAAVALILAGGWLTARALLIEPGTAHTNHTPGAPPAIHEHNPN